MKDPLAHFLIAGAVLFLALSIANPPDGEDRIVVDRAALLSFIQYRSKAFEPRAAGALLDGMSAEERRRLIGDYIREEALYREARALGLDQGDYVIRRRMVQKLEFMTEAATAREAPDENALEDYYQRNKQDYFRQPSVTFAHVFFSASDRGVEAAMAKASNMLVQLQRDGAGYSDATRYGERFLFHTNYVERTYDYVKSHFGEPAATAIFSNEAPLSAWRGPIASDHGAHLVLVTERTSGEVPPLPAIRARVAKDMARARRRTDIDALIDGIIEDYAPLIAPDLLDEAPDPVQTSGPDQ